MKPKGPLNFTYLCKSLRVPLSREVLFSDLTLQIPLHDYSAANDNL